MKHKITKQQRAGRFKNSLLLIMKRYGIQTLRVFDNKLIGYDVNYEDVFEFSRLENTPFMSYNKLNSDWMTKDDSKS